MHFFYFAVPRKYLIALILITVPSSAMDDFSIETYNKKRDKDSIKKILLHDHKEIDYLPSMFEKELLDPNRNTDVIRTRDKTVGVVQYWTQTGCDLFLDFQKFGYIRLIAVDQEYREKGLGNALLDCSMRNIEKSNVSYTYLIVSRKNIAAKKLYENAGFSSDLTKLPFFDLNSFLPNLGIILPSLEKKREVYYKNYDPFAAKVLKKNTKKCALFVLATGFGILSTYLGCSFFDQYQ